LALLVGITYAARSSSNTRGGLAVAIKMQIRRGTLTAWASANPVLVAGELGFVTDAGKTAFKIGDGTLAWTSLAYVNSTYPELLPDAGGDLDLATVQGRYPLLNASTYTNDPSEFSGGATDGDSVLMVTVPASGIVIQELTTSKTSKRWIRGKNAGTWSAWQRLHGVIATDSLTVVNLTATGTVVANQLGVGVSSPQAKIHVAVSNPTRGIVGIVTNTGTSSLTGSQIQLTQNTIQDYVIGQPATVDALAVWRGRNTATDGTELVRLTSTALASTVNVTAPGMQAGSSGLTSSGGLTVSSGTTELAVPLVLATAAAAGTSVFSTKNTGGTVVTTIRGDGVPTAGTDLATKSYVDAAGAVYNGTLAAIQNFVLSNGSPPSYTLSIASNSIGVEHWYKVTSTSNPSSGSPRFADIFITVPSGVSAIFTVESNYGVGDGLGITFAPAPTAGRIIPAATVATVRLSNGSGSVGLAGIAAGWFSVKKIVTI
jgi:hypothetical protein